MNFLVCEFYLVKRFMNKNTKEKEYMHVHHERNVRESEDFNAGRSPKSLAAGPCWGAEQEVWRGRAGSSPPGKTDSETPFLESHKACPSAGTLRGPGAKTSV